MGGGGGWERRRERERQTDTHIAADEVGVEETRGGVTV